ncbi:AAA family ATPase, partial [Streptomyces sp. SID724]|nr:AAA family ATPase [Streptomyces sp. SID724]
MTNDTTTTTNTPEDTTAESTITDSTTVGAPGRAATPGREHRQITLPEDRYATELAFLAA